MAIPSRAVPSVVVVCRFYLYEKITWRLVWPRSFCWINYTYLHGDLSQKYGHPMAVSVIYFNSSLSFFVEVVDISKFSVSHRSSINEERFELDLLRAFQTGWFEVAIWAHKIGEDFPEFLVPDEIIELFPTSSPNRKRSRIKSTKRRSGRLHSDTGLYSQLP